MLEIKLYKPLLALFFIVGLLITASAQPERKRAIEIGSFMQCNQTGDLSKGQNGCRLIYELAVPRARNPKKSTIDYDFQITFDRNEYTDTGQFISGRISITGISDLKLYEGFDMGAFLLPSSVCLKATSDQSHEAVNIHFRDSVASYRLFLKGSRKQEDPSFTIDQIECDEAKVERFLDGLMMIRDYLAFAGLAEDLNTLEKLRYKDPWQEASAIVWFSHAGQLIDKLEVWNAPELNGQDPKKIAGSMKAVSIEAYRRQLAFIREGQSEQLALQPYSEASVAWIGNQIEWLIRHKENSNPYSTSLINRLATLGSAPSWGGLNSLVADVWPLEEAAARIGMLKPFLHAQAMDLNQRARERINKEKFSEALLFANNAALIAQLADDTELATSANQLISTAHHGVLNAWLTIAQRALQAGSFSMAGQYIQKAAAYQQANHEAILSMEALNHTLECYIDSSLSKATRLVLKGDYTEAVARIDDATVYLNRLPFYSQRSQIDFILSQACTKQYEHQLNHAVELLDNNKRDAGSALLFKTIAFRASRSMWVTQREEEKTALRLTGLFEADSLLQIALKADTIRWHALYPLADRAAALLDTIAPVPADTVKWKSGSFTVNQMLRAEQEFYNTLSDNNYQLADDQRKAIQQRLQIYIAVSDPVHAEILREIEKRINQSACVLADSWGKTLTDAGYDAAIAKQFRQAFDLITKARQVYQEAARCNPDTTTMAQIGNRYREVWLFQKQVAKVDTLLMQYRVEEAVAWFDLCRSDYERNFMKLVDMPAPRLEIYLLQYPTAPLIDIVMERNLYKTSTNDLIALFESLRQKNIPSDLLKNWLPELGNVMASDYHQAGKEKTKESYLSVFKIDRIWYKPSSVRFIDDVARNWFERKWMQLGMIL
ncbi:MAG TPA: hypothetical protein DCR43_00460 [Bacteroidales bacterium]|nr:MAG: hypothetical protein A2X11_13190 [Bacteroidetes bacterium GWE2_42_24]OFY25359.1 MAG: hypothetical protein A2X09_10395 [Bacteroidetes bacterium GWF2_43_11]HAQ64323.1 hypothetical protein [Bacteroidales bacterium]HBZ67643.1 hypothetical protein [Bacteroidales bacterium]